jgi:hypothetical protein
MSSEVTTIAVAVTGWAVGGTIGAAGVLLGLLLGRRFREMPRVEGVASEWDMRVYERAGPQGRLVCSFEVDLFNEGAFGREDGGRVAVSRLKDAASKGDLRPLDLPSRRWTHASVYALLEGDEARDTQGFRRVYLPSEFPGGGAFESKMVERGDFVATRKRVADARKDYLAGRNLRARFPARKRTAG